MGRIGEAFGRELGGTITYGAEVRALHRSRNGAQIVWRYGSTGRERAIEAPLVVVTVPLPVLRTIPADFSPDVRAAIEAVDYVPAVKVAFQAERRFWEVDDAIYGSISWTTRDITRSGIPRRASTSERAFWLAPISGPMTSARSSLRCRPPRASWLHWTTANGCIRTVAGI
jgi:monoamine oxidase